MNEDGDDSFDQTRRTLLKFGLFGAVCGVGASGLSTGVAAETDGLVFEDEFSYTDSPFNHGWKEDTSNPQNEGCNDITMDEGILRNDAGSYDHCILYRNISFAKKVPPGVVLRARSVESNFGGEGKVIVQIMADNKNVSTSSEIVRLTFQKISPRNMLSVRTEGTKTRVTADKLSTAEWQNMMVWYDGKKTYAGTLNNTFLVADASPPLSSSVRVAINNGSSVNEYDYIRVFAGEPSSSSLSDRYKNLRNQKRTLAQQIDTHSVSTLDDQSRAATTLTGLTDAVQNGEIAVNTAEQAALRLVEAEQVTDRTLTVAGPGTDPQDPDRFNLAKNVARTTVNTVVSMTFTAISLSDATERIVANADELPFNISADDISELLDEAIGLLGEAIGKLLNWALGDSDQTTTVRQQSRQAADTVYTDFTNDALSTAEEIQTALRNAVAGLDDSIAKLLRRGIETGRQAELHIHADGTVHRHGPTTNAAVDIDAALTELHDILDAETIKQRGGLRGSTDDARAAATTGLQNTENIASNAATWIDGLSAASSELNLLESLIDLWNAVRDGRWLDAITEVLSALAGVKTTFITPIVDLVSGLSGFAAFSQLRTNHVTTTSRVMLGDADADVL